MDLRETLILILGRIAEDEDQTRKKMQEYEVNHPTAILHGGYLQGLIRCRIMIQNALTEQKPRWAIIGPDRAIWHRSMSKSGTIEKQCERLNRAFLLGVEQGQVERPCEKSYDDLKDDSAY